MRTAAGRCPNEDTLLAFLHGRVPTARADVGKHLEDCLSCAEVAAWAAADRGIVGDDVSRDRTEGAGDAGAGAQLAPGMRVDRFHILGLIGRGGMGEVYAAYHPDLDRRIALKVVYGARATDPERQARLLREARIIARLSHPNIVSVYDAGMVGEQVYLAMEFVDGETVDAWLRQTSRGWRDVLQVFAAAGRGLTAAHAASVIHRDFKPQNVMIGRDGRVRVMDFGLARSVLDAHEPARTITAEEQAATTSTTVGALVGTPAYMAPEQLRNARIDVRADQFSFCVGLHEGIYGARPAAGLTPSRDRRGRRVPLWLRRIIRKGLEADRERRFPSMQALLRAIDRGRSWLRGPLVAAGLVGLLAAAAVVGARVSKPRLFACTPPRDRLQAVWPSVELPGSRRSNLHHLFATAGWADGQSTWEKLAAMIDDRLRQWRAMYQDACEATHVRGEQSLQILDLRMTCLTDSLDATRAYLDGLLVADSSRLHRALPGAAALPSIDRCGDLKDLRSQMPLPADAAARDKVVRLQQAINDAEALRSLRYEKRAEEDLQALLPEIRALGYKPLLAQALQRLGAAQAELEHYADARQTAQEALDVAEASRDDLTVALVAEGLGAIQTETGHYPDGRESLRFGEAAVERAGAQGTLVHGWLMNDEGNLHYDQGDFEQAERDHRAALAIKARVLGPRHPDISGSMINLAMDLAELNRWTEADAVSKAALQMDDQVGNQHSRAYAAVETVRAEILIHAGRLDEAEAALTDALSVEQELGYADLVMSVTLTDLGAVYLARRRPAEALHVLRRAQVLQGRAGEGNPIRLAMTGWQVGRAMIEARANVARGEQTAAEACATLARGGYSRVRGEILAWSERLAAPARRRIAGGCAAGGAGAAPLTQGRAAARR